MNTHVLRFPIRWGVLLAGAVLAGCSAFKPVVFQERHFVLSPSPPETAGPARTPVLTPAAVGLGPVLVAPYLATRALAVRRGQHEVVYPEGLFWAERLDKGARRVLALDLAQLLPGLSVKSSPWRSDEVGAEIRVQIDRLDVDVAGQGVLEASWRIVAGDPATALRSGHSCHTQAGPSPVADPDGAVGTLSALLGLLSAELVEALGADPPG